MADGRFYDDLTAQVRALGHQGGRLSPSVYDTAQVLCSKVLPPDAANTTMAWLLRQQRADGGWGPSQMTSRHRDVSTLAALVAITALELTKDTQDRVEAGVAFLRERAQAWSSRGPGTPIAAELTIPYLFDAAPALRSLIPQQAYANLRMLRTRRKDLLSTFGVRPGSFVLHAGETLALAPEPALLDTNGGVGSSPASTAVWIAAARGCPSLSAEVAQAMCYLESASAASVPGIPGVMPTLWPVDHFEVAVGLHTLLDADLLTAPSLAALTRRHCVSLARSFRPEGLGLSSAFVTDSDTTAAACQVLAATGFRSPVETLWRFIGGDHAVLFHNEPWSSLLATARSVRALAGAGRDVSRLQAWLVQQQDPMGRWSDDTRSGSWLYTTWQVITALADGNHTAALHRAWAALLTEQRPDGSWGDEVPMMEPTACGVLALRALIKAGMWTSVLTDAVERGQAWLKRHYVPGVPSIEQHWVSKELYRPERVSRIITLAALLAPLPVAIPMLALRS